MQGRQHTPFRTGVAHGMPFLFVIVPFGALFGVLATEAGLSLVQSLVFSMLVIAGASQFTAIQLMVDNVPFAIVIASAMAVNLRMVMYSAALVPHLGPAPLWQRAVISYLMVDQVYALSQSAYDEHLDWSVQDKVAYLTGVSIPVFPGWVGATWAGVVVGSLVPEEWALDFIMPLAFMALVGPMLRTRAHVAAAISASIVALLAVGIPWNLGLILAGITGMAVGAEVERRS